MTTICKVLFICGKNRLRSPTAEQVFSGRSGIECASAGVNRDADQPVSGELLEWADLIFVMEKTHRDKLTSCFRQHLKDQRIVCLNIPDKFKFMAPELVELLLEKVAPHLPTVVSESPSSAENRAPKH